MQSNFQCSVLLMILCGGTQALAASADPVAAATWLSGCWAAKGAEAGSGEHWMAPAGGTMLGMGRTVKNGQTVAYEYMQLRVMADGKLAFIATPAGQPATTFVQIAAVAAGADQANSLIFENLQHDFPQRIIYRQLSAERVLGRIEGTQAGVASSVDFPLQRISCDELQRNK